MGAGGRTRPSNAVPVVVVSRARMVRDAVRTALRSAGFPATSIGVPVDSAQFSEARRVVAPLGLAVGLFLTELDDPRLFRDAVSVLRRLDLVWLVLTATPPGPVWAAVHEAGARNVIPDDVRLAELSEEILGLRGAPRQSRDLERAHASWRRLGPEGRDLIRRLELLSPREMEILVQLHEGLATKEIAAASGVSHDTVRTQVKSLLHKLEVTSQLEAVSYYRTVACWLRG